MRVLIGAVLCLLAAAGPGACDERSRTETNFTFSLPFFATQEDYRPKHPEGLSLADSFEPGRNVAVISGKGVCTARTSSTFRYEIPGGAEFEATHLEGPEKCGSYVAAVVGVDPRAVRTIPLSDDSLPVPKDMEAKARELLRDYDLQEGVEIIAPRLVKPGGSQTAPRALGVSLITFGFGVKNELVWENGPSVLFVNDTAFRLGGNCTWGPIFFTIQGKLHLAYTAQEACCSGESILYVCDLSGEAPKKVYENGRLSD